jgi:hypothetical protein
MKYAIEIASCGMIYVPSFMKIGTGLKNLRGCNVGITDWRYTFSYAVEMDSGAVIYVPSFIDIGSDFQNLTGGYIDTQTHTQIASKIRT